MKLPSFKRINKSDYPKDLGAVIDKLAFSLNVAIDNLFELANNRVSFGDNIYCDVKQVTFTVDGNGTPTTNVVINLTNLANINSKVTGVTVKAATNSSSSTRYVLGAPFISFTQNGNAITVNNVRGLVPGDEYTLTVQIDG